MTPTTHDTSPWLGLFPGDVALAVGDPAADSEALFPEEAALLTRAVEKRQREFKKGRECARHALKDVGGPHVAIPQGPSREPIWPAGFVGSISHTHGLCAAVAARSTGYLAVGVDLEPAESIEPGLWPRIAGDGEARAFQRAAAAAGLSAGAAMRVLFSMKECFYKCQHEVSRTFMGFHDASVLLDGSAFHVRFEKDIAAFTRGTVLSGTWREAEGFFMTAMVLR